MSPFFELISIWLREFWEYFLLVLPRWFVAWLLCLLFLIYTFRYLKPKLRLRVVHFDDVTNSWARRLRYKLQQVDAALEPDTPPAERHLLTWFFRFWTNFASAPSLGFFAFAVPIYFYFQYSQLSAAESADAFRNQSHWLIPTFCYYGSMGLSFVLKRVFKRVRPVRDKGSFGHSLRDGSFPSGHSLTAFCFWLPMIVSVFLHSQSLALTAAFAIIAVAVVFLTGLSRIYMAVHWPSDVAGGFVIGAVWLTAFAVAFSGWF